MLQPSTAPLIPPPVSSTGPVPSLSASGLASLVTAMGFLGFISIGGVTQLASVAFGLWWCELFLFFGVPFVGLKLSGRSPWLSTGFTRPWLSGCVFGFALGLTNFFAVVAPIQFIAQKVAPKSWLDLYDAAKVFQDKGPLELLVIALGVCVAAPLGEEFFFRGALQRGWASRMGPLTAIFFTGAVFSAFHLDPIGFPARWELGVLFGLLAWRTGSLWPGIFAHLANNLTSTLLYFAFKDQKQDPTDDVTAILTITGLGGLALLGVLLLGRKFPSALRSPQPAVEALQPAASPAAIARWMLAAFGSFALLLVLDFRGSMVRGMDMVTPVKAENAELKALREQAREGKAPLMQYFLARKNAPKGAGALDAGR
ncbi:MAG: CPBP family intramembrane metalloprotease [Archangiaceae bacterium]|nr:CPBP family intramembrane metalloprotease [Archangiaceae bacterium]